ncbi:MAG: hypothetical protein Q7K39_00870, partial [Candidatus Magasanikbacteria bacterium]|nr:hypothetical protein [Candidatus Magasanikbacteria bacterium]
FLFRKFIKKLLILKTILKNTMDRKSDWPIELVRPLQRPLVASIGLLENLIFLHYYPIPTNSYKILKFPQLKMGGYSMESMTSLVWALQKIIITKPTQ